MKNSLFLAQSDTTAGFLSKDKNLILKAKQRSKNKAILQTSASIFEIKKICRIPQIINKQIRRVRKTSFIFPNGEAFRVVRDSKHKEFLEQFGLMYSSSANISGFGFDKDFAFNVADIIILDRREIYENKPSNIFKIKKNNIQKIR